MLDGRLHRITDKPSEANGPSSPDEHSASLKPRINAQRFGRGRKPSAAPLQRFASTPAHAVHPVHSTPVHPQFNELKNMRAPKLFAVAARSEQNAARANQNTVRSKAKPWASIFRHHPWLNTGGVQDPQPAPLTTSCISN